MRVGRAAWVRLAAVGALLIASSGCQSAVAGHGTALVPPAASSSAPTAGAEPSVRPTHPAPSSASSGLQFRPVDATAASPCDAGEYPDPDGADCYRLGPPILTATSDVRSAASQSARGDWQVSITLNPADSARLKAYTRGHVGERMAIMLDGEVLIAPVVQAAIGRSIVINGDLTETSAKALAQRIAS